MGGHSTNLKVSSKSAPHSVAGALAGVLRDNATCEIQVIGAGAVNQAVKAMAIARAYLNDDGWDLACVPSFAEVEINERPRTAIRFLIERRAHAASPGPGASGLEQPGIDAAYDPEAEVPGGIFADGRRRGADRERDP